MLRIRPALIDDIDAIVDTDPIGLSRAEEIADLVRTAASFVAIEAGEMQGFVAIKPAHFYGRDFVDLLFVGANFRRRGVGSALLQWAVRNASTARIFVSTNESNAPMRALLEKGGWTLSGILRGLDEGDPEHVFYIDR